MDTETNVGTEAFQIPETAIDAFDKVLTKPPKSTIHQKKSMR